MAELLYLTPKRDVVFLKIGNLLLESDGLVLECSDFILEFDDHQGLLQSKFSLRLSVLLLSSLIPVSRGHYDDGGVLFSNVESNDHLHSRLCSNTVGPAKTSFEV